MSIVRIIVRDMHIQSEDPVIIAYSILYVLRKWGELFDETKEKI
jgi:hypothetical protein